MKYYRDDSHASVPESYTRSRRAKNPLCGDDISLYAEIEGDTVRRIGYKGKGCSISLAAGSMLCSTVEGMTVKEAGELADRYLRMLEEEGDQEFPEHAYLEAMQAVKKYPGRLACARLAWETFRDMLRDDDSN
jgi:nitrogen fixation NifU-like protein